MKGTPRRVLAQAPRLTGWLIFLATLSGLVAAGHAGVHLLPVLTGSMAPYAPAGSLVVAVPVSGDDVVTGDVVAFRPPAPYTVSGDRPVLHRVVELGDGGGVGYMVTKGDANDAADPWRVSTDGAQFGRAVAVVPHLGRMLSGGSWTVLALVFGASAVRAGLRRPEGVSGGRHRIRRGGRRTVHRDPHRRTITVTLDVPPDHMQEPDGAQRAGARARAALVEGLATLDLSLRTEPAEILQPDERGGGRLTLSATAVPAHPRRVGAHRDAERPRGIA